MVNLPVPSERTWATNDLSTAALLNTNMRDGINFLLNVPTFYGYQATPQSVSGATWTAITIDTNVYDTYNGHSTLTNNTEYVAQVAGIYMVIARVGWNVNATGVRGVAVTYNGGSVTATTPQVVTATIPSGNGAINEVVAFQQMNVGDYVQAEGYQSSGGSLSTFSGAMQIFWMHS